ncbi:SDR family NAD(P)-dependent oxidoreductase [Streptomyces anulatus]
MTTEDGKQKKPRWTAEQIPDQTGRVSVVTGANSGLGLATARALARRGCHVILAVRDEEKGRRAAAAITADRYRTDRIFTLDQRDFRAMSPLTPGLDAFRILPADG